MKESFNRTINQSTVYPAEHINSSIQESQSVAGEYNPMLNCFISFCSMMLNQMSLARPWQRLQCLSNHHRLCSAPLVGSYHSCPAAFWSLSALEQLQGPHHQWHIRCLPGVRSGTSLRRTSVQLPKQPDATHCARFVG